MKNTFVFDESAIHCAATGRDEKGRDDASAFSLLSDLASNCHAIAFSKELWGKTQSRLSSLAKSGEYVNPVFDRLNVLLTNPDKFIFLDVPPPLDSEVGIPRKDRFVVRLASYLRAILVTTDNRLMRRISRDPVTHQHQIQATLRPEAALAYAGPQ